MRFSAQDAAFIHVKPYISAVAAFCRMIKQIKALRFSIGFGMPGIAGPLERLPVMKKFDSSILPITIDMEIVFPVRLHQIRLIDHFEAALAYSDLGGIRWTES